MSGELYDTDFYAWANQQAALLRAGKLSEADVANIAEEVESMGRGEKRELVRRLGVLLLHMLKWRYQPERRSASWEASITVQRRDIARHLHDNPSLKAKVAEAIEDAYGDAALMAMGETNLPKATFPAECPWTWGEISDQGFWPESGPS